jgi:hypothetical protein
MAEARGRKNAVTEKDLDKYSSRAHAGSTSEDTGMDLAAVGGRGIS